MQYPPTLSQYLLSQLAENPECHQLALIMQDLAVIGKLISAQINKAGLLNILGAAGLTNIQGEQVQKLDVLANTLCRTYLSRTGHFAAMASEEEEMLVELGEMGKDAKYVIAFDPLDGSSNIDVNVSIGTIFSVLRRRIDIDRSDERQFQQKGSEQVLAGYILYGSSTVLVFSFGDGVHEFTLDQSLGEFFLSHERIQMPDTCAYLSINEINLPQTTQDIRDFVEQVKREHEPRCRYIGSLVADFHRNLKKGGVFLYPSVDERGTGGYKAKLRLNYEAKPMAFLLAQAGGYSTNGQHDILDLEGESLHQRVPLIFGNKGIVKLLEI